MHLLYLCTSSINHFNMYSTSLTLPALFMVVLFLFNSRFVSGQELTGTAKLYSQGYNYFTEKKYQKAIDTYSMTIDDAANPKNVYAFYYIGLSYHELKKYNDAEASYRSAMLIDKTKPEIMFARGINDCFRGDYMSAWFSAMAAISLDSTKAEYWDLKAIGSLGQDWPFTAAIDAYSKAILLEPSAIYYYKRGKVYAEMGKYELSRPDFDKARNLDPNVEKAFDNPRDPFNSGNASVLLGKAPVIIDLGDATMIIDSKGKTSVTEKQKPKKKEETTLLGFAIENKFEYAGEYQFKYHYTFNEAVKACPPGYRMPTLDDWVALVDYIVKDQNINTRYRDQFIYHIGLGWERTYNTQNAVTSKKLNFMSKDNYSLNITPKGIYTGETTSVSVFALPDATGFWIEPVYRDGKDLNAVVIDAGGMIFARFNDKAKLCVKYIKK